ncbi:MAG: outer membrane lipoprotein carrier protein LolA [Candidatus Aerophobetes bacterium]|nr:outer membrane lipoprotein carrier protein LolA [Candidatus Aerophobetes bacterium]
MVGVKAKYSLLVLILILAITLVFVSSSYGSLLVEEIISKLEASSNKIRDYQGLMVVTVKEDGRKRKGKIRIMVKKPDKLLIELLSPPLSAGQIIVVNGKKVWMYDPDYNEVRICDLSQVPQVNKLSPERTNLDIMKMLYDVELLGQEKIGEEKAYVLELKSKNGVQGKERIWIDSQRWIVLQLAFYDPMENLLKKTIFKDIRKVNDDAWMAFRQNDYDSRGRLIRTVVFQDDISFNTDIPEGKFVFKIPEGARIIDYTKEK